MDDIVEDKTKPASKREAEGEREHGALMRLP